LPGFVLKELDTTNKKQVSENREQVEIPMFFPKN
jgi:hypothetical protein